MGLTDKIFKYGSELATGAYKTVSGQALVPNAASAIKKTGTTLREDVADFFLGGITNTLSAKHMGATWEDALKGAYYAGDKFQWGRAAGTASMLGVGWRFASGGGLYKDKNGNFDVAGVPFI